MVVLSKDKAAYRQNWNKIVGVFEGDGLIKGKVKSVVKGGLMVNIGVEAFLPASQIDVVPPKDLQQFVGNTYDFKIVKLNDDRKNVVLSRSEVIEQDPSELLKVGQPLEVVVLDINKEKERVSLGLKQTQKNPWDQIEERFPAGQRIKGKITNLVPYGAFVELEDGIDGMIQVSDLSWTRKINHPSEVFKKNDEVEAVVLGVNTEEQ